MNMRVGCWVLGLVFVLTGCLFVDAVVLGVPLPLPEENTWVELAPMQQPRSNLCVAAVDGKIYAIGGRYVIDSYAMYSSSTRDQLGTNEMYDPITNTWTYRAPMPIPCNGFAVAVFEGKIYCIDAWFTLVYDPVLDVWENRTAMPIPRNLVQANTLGEKIYVVGGEPNGSLTLAYDPLTDTWSQRASMPEGFRVFSSAAYDDKLCIVGLYADPSYWETDGLLHPSKVVPMVEVYDPEQDTWSGIKTGTNIFYNGFSRFCVDTVCVYVHTGVATLGVYAPAGFYWLYNPSSAHMFDVFELGVFDWGSSSWRFGAALPSERQSFAVVVLDDLIYVVGGHTIGFDAPYGIPQYHLFSSSALVERYTPFGYGKVAPMVRVLSLEEGGEYDSEDVLLEFGLSRRVVWMGYSLDGAKNVTVGGNVSLSGLSEGIHFVQVFVEDEFSNVGVSDVLNFSVVVAEGEEVDVFPVVLAGLVVLVVVFVVVGGVVLLRRRHR